MTGHAGELRLYRWKAFPHLHTHFHRATRRRAKFDPDSWREVETRTVLFDEDPSSRACMYLAFTRKRIRISRVLLSQAATMCEDIGEVS